MDPGWGGGVISYGAALSVSCLHRWLSSFVSRVLHHLKAFLSQAASSHEQRLETHRNILARLVALTERSQAFLKALEMEVDARYQEGQPIYISFFASGHFTQHVLITTWLHVPLGRVYQLVQVLQSTSLTLQLFIVFAVSTVSVAV